LAKGWFQAILFKLSKLVPVGCVN